MANKKQQKVKQAAKEAVRQATAAGQAVTKQQTNALRQAGVKTSNAKSLISANRAAVSAAQSQTATPTTPKPTTPEIKGPKQALRIAGGGAGIGKEELRTILAETNQPGKLIQQLDDINTKLSKKDKTGIGLTSGAANMLIRRGTKYKQKGGPVSPLSMLIDEDKRNKYNFGTGFIGSALTERLGSAGTRAVPAQRGGSGAIIGSGRAATDPTPGQLQAQGMDIGPKGRERVRDEGKQYEVPKRFLGDGGEKTKIISKEENPPTTESWTSGPTEGGTEEPVAPEETVDKSLSSGAGGLDLASWATGFRTARSSRRKAGKGSQGLGSMKKAPFTSWFK